MIVTTENRRALPRISKVAGIIAGGMMLVSATAMAGECPADKVVPSGQGQQAGATTPKDVTDTVLASIDLSKEMVAANDHQLRMRRLEIQPGGEVPWHNHADRPAIIYIVKGTVTEYADVCKVPIVHNAGEVSVDAGRQHWWKNTGSETAILISADILHDKKDSSM